MKKNKSILICIGLVMILQPSIYCDTVKDVKKDYVYTYKGSFLNENTIQADSLLLKMEYENPKTQAEHENFIKEQLRLLKKSDYKLTAEDRLPTQCGYFIFSGRTGDKTFEIKHLMGMEGGNSNDYPAMPAPTIIKMYFDDKTPFQLINGIMLKMIKMEGNNLTYQLIAPNELKDKITKD